MDMDLNSQKLKEMSIRTSEKSEQIDFINYSLFDVNKNISDLSRTNEDKKLILSNIKKTIFDINVSNDKLIIEINRIKESVKETILSKEKVIDINIQEQYKIIKEKESEISINNNRIKNLVSNLEKTLQDITNIENEINNAFDNKETFSYLSQLINFKENPSNLKIDNLIIKPEWIDDFVDSYLDEKFPKELLDKIIFLKWDKHTGKHSLIKAIWNKLNRPIFRIKYDDYFNDDWLYNIFDTLKTYLRNQRKQKNENIEYYNEILKQIETIKKTSYSKNQYKDIRDIEWNVHTLDFGTSEWKRSWLSILNNSINTLKEYIDSIEDSCILYVDDLDRIIQSSKYEKWELLWPIKTVINDIKDENHDVILMLVGNDLWNNHNDFKWWIDRVFEFKWIDNTYGEVFDKMLSKYIEKFGIKWNIGNFNLGNIDKEYRNIKFLDKLAKGLIKIYLKESKK